jgi:hypothetical protein
VLFRSKNGDVKYPSTGIVAFKEFRLPGDRPGRVRAAWAEAGFAPCHLVEQVTPLARRFTKQCLTLSPIKRRLRRLGARERRLDAPARGGSRAQRRKARW